MVEEVMMHDPRDGEVIARVTAWARRMCGKNPRTGTAIAALICGRSSIGDEMTEENARAWRDRAIAWIMTQTSEDDYNQFLDPDFPGVHGDDPLPDIFGPLNGGMDWVREVKRRHAERQAALTKSG